MSTSVVGMREGAAPGLTAPAPVSVLGHYMRRVATLPRADVAGRIAARLVSHARAQRARVAWAISERGAVEARADAALAVAGARGDVASAVREWGRAALFTAADERRAAWLTRFATDAERARVLANADAVCRHEFALLGSAPTVLGPEIPWSTDFKSGSSWPLRFHRVLGVYRPGDASDVKVPWELSRFQHLPLLGKAYWLTGDERYAGEAARQQLAWLRANPLGYGVNWKCGMEVAIRAVNWIHAFGMFAGSPSFEPEAWRQILTSLFCHGTFLRDNLEYHPVVRGNHYLSDLVGLAFLGRLFGYTAEGAEWAAFARRELLTEIEYQVLPDGVSHEMSTAYHALVLELFLWGAAVLARGHGDGSIAERIRIFFGPAFAERLQAMFGFLEALTRPDGALSLIGDHDDGRLHLLARYRGWRPDSAERLLTLGAAVFEVPTSQPGDPQGTEEAWWLEPSAAFRPAASLAETAEVSVEAAIGIPLRDRIGDERSARAAPPAQGRAFPHAGFFTLRSGGDQVLVRCGPVGLKGGGGHDHCDQLALEVCLRGVPLLVDPGCYVYTGDAGARNLFRGTAYHNTVAVDGCEQNDFDGYNLFSMRERTFSRALEWSSGPERDRFVGEHSGYVVLERGLVHRREIELDRVLGLVIVRDRLPAERPHVYRWHWHLAPDARVLPASRAGPRVIAGEEFVEVQEIEVGGESFVLASTFGGVDRLDGWISRSYGVRVRAPILRWQSDAPNGASAAFVVASLSTWLAA